MTYKSKYLRREWLLSRLIQNLKIIQKAKERPSNIPRHCLLDVDWLLETKRLELLRFENGKITLIANI